MQVTEYCSWRQLSPILFLSDFSDKYSNSGFVNVVNGFQRLIAKSMIATSPLAIDSAVPSRALSPSALW